ncbi:family 10 glycosylhydrolase [Leptolyngbya sp. BC1307]|uniref:glycoside hydrolase family 10 protein n=1 Tax=Leptolyngbya sp. BC1307 TaxID=2029589 RepID=UPI000EFD466D|nr:family 10 glycosylhydrolase [Leptolyngbya sp. BC1307]
MIQVFCSRIAAHAAEVDTRCPTQRRFHSIYSGLASGLISLAFGAAVAHPAIALSPETVSPNQLAYQRLPGQRPQTLSQSPTTDPSNPLNAQAMYRELENLTGRFESAYLSSRAQNQPTQLHAADLTLTASASITVTTPTPLPSELQAAQQLLTDWQGLINQGDYEMANRRWQTVSQALRSSARAGEAIAQPEIRAMWLDRKTIVTAGSQAGLAKVFERFKAAGINTVFVETVNAGYPIYPSSVAPAQNPLIRGWDPLQAAVELGQTYGIEVHAWVWLFAAGNQAHNQVIGQPASYPGPIISAHPDWAGYDNQGNLILPGQAKPFLDPANPEVRQYLFDLLSEIASRYDVDGIQFDYIRYPFQDPANNRLFGYGTAGRQQFHQLTGVDPIILSPHASGGDAQLQQYYWNQWTAFRTEQISSFVAEASHRLRRQRPNLILSAAVFADDTYKRQQTIQQDWETWADQELIDWIVLMSYASTTQRFEELIRPWIMESSYRSTLVIPGIRLLNLPAAIASEQLQLLRDLPTSGYALFAADNLNSDVQAMLARTQQDPDQAFSAQTPFVTAAARYESLQREWSWLLTNQQIHGDSRRLQQWANEVNQLGTALAALAENPSDRGLMGVRSRLNTLERSLASSLTVEAASPAYRLRAWQNRLTAIDRLLTHDGAGSNSSS